MSDLVLDDAIAAATRIGGCHGARRLVAVGVRDLASLARAGEGRLRVCLVDRPEFAPTVASAPGLAEVLTWDPATQPMIPWLPTLMTDCVIVCDLASFVDPDPVLAALAEASAYVPAVLIVGAAAGRDEPGDAAVADCHGAIVDRLVERCARNGLAATFAGLQGGACGRPIVIVDSIVSPNLEPAPPTFRVAAILTSYNEADVIGPAIRGLVAEGVEVHLIDNWSTDATWDIASAMLGRELATLERYPASPPDTYDWADLLRRKEQLASTLGADWYIHHDADERRLSPWPGVSLRDALWTVDRSGFTVVDHTSADHPPVDDGFAPGTDYEAYFTDFRWTPGNDVRINAWKAMRRPALVHLMGGHVVQFSGARLFPYNFLLHHYPIRSQAHGARKVLGERKARWNESERASGWHVHYDAVTIGHNYLEPPSALSERDGSSFARHDLLVRLTRTGREAANDLASIGGGRCSTAADEFALSLVVLVNGEPQTFLSSLEAAREATAPLGPVDTVLVAAGEAAWALSDAVEFAALGRWIRFGPGIEPSEVWKRAFAAARGSFVLAITDDVEVDTGGLNALLDLTAADPQGIVAVIDPRDAPGVGVVPSAFHGVLRFGARPLVRPGGQRALVSVLAEPV